jgi:pimeloyl-ACP methyl ester carboxylesterase
VARRALVLVPKAPQSPRSLLVLLHGLGETGNELLGIHAWGDAYGLVRAYERLRQPPIIRNPKLGYLSAEREKEINESMARDPFDGLTIVCPVTPNPYGGAASKLLDGYANWLVDVLLPTVRERLRLSSEPLRVGLDGCSLGGYVGLEVMLRRPEVFQSMGVVQPAIGQHSARRYAASLAEAIARVGPRSIHIETSSQDPYREPSRLLSEELMSLGVPNEYRLAPGPHDQPWLREVGTLEMLLWHERQLKVAVSRKPQATR